MKVSSFSFYLLMLGSFFIGLLLSIYPIPGHYTWLRPEFLCLLVIYWSIFTPHHFGVGIAWLVGMSQDVIEGGMWGTHALALAFLAYIGQMAYQRLRSYFVWQQIMWVFVFVGIHQMFVNWVQDLSGYGVPVYLVLLPSLASALFWPLLVVVLHGLRGRYRLLNLG